MNETPKLNKREIQRNERRKQILECSLDMIISRGYDAMKIRDIADKLHISTGLFFNYFESKEKVYEELIKVGLTGPQNVLLLNVDGVAPIELFESMTTAIFQSLESNSFVSKMFLLMARTINSDMAPGSVKKLVSDFDVITPILPVIKRGQTLHQIKEGDARALAVAYWGAVQGIAEQIAFWDDLPIPESSWVVDILRANC